ncbi:MAG: lysophospholipid acyltransferase family protein [Steroidobacteraceae bacterium]
MAHAVTQETQAVHPAWWVWLLSALPWWLLYGLADLLAWLAWRVVRYQEGVARENLSIAFPELDARGLHEVMRRYYRGFGEVLVEVVKAARLSPEAIRHRVTLQGLEPVRGRLAAGVPVLLVAAHQCNWEWMLLALSLELGFPLDAAYKPLVDPWAEREMLALRTRFGSRLVPAQDLLGDIIRRGRTPRAIAMVADQEPRTSEHKHWTRFLNRDTAFYVGAEEIARVTKFPVFFVAMRRVRRGFYEVSVEPLADGGAAPAPGELTERYARRAEEQIRSAPPDWPWSHKRWKLKRSLYQRGT